MVGNVTGMVCDGAKADCALKISTCVNAACQAAAMGTRGVRVQSTDGIVEENVERTLDNFAILSTHGTSDSVILDLMLNKNMLRTPNKRPRKTLASLHPHPAKKHPAPEAQEN